MNVQDLLSSESAPECPPSPTTSVESCSSASSDTPKRGWVAPFLLHLHQMLRREDPRIIRWTEDGMAFQILDKEAMTTQILPKYFKNKNFSSFQRQLNYFGFRKWSKARAQFPTYSREHFTRDKFNEMSLVKRQSKKSRKRKAADEEQQPAKRAAVAAPNYGVEKCKPILPRPGTATIVAPTLSQPNGATSSFSFAQHTVIALRAHMKLLLLLMLLPLARACTMIAVGRNATIDGSTLVAHTDDAGFGAADLRMVRVPAQDHEDGAMRHVYNVQPGYPRLVTSQRGSEYEPKNDQEQLMTPLGEIPQVPHTYGYFDQDYGFMNEVQLSMERVQAEPGQQAGPRTLAPRIQHVRHWRAHKVALERCDSARCAIQVMGDLAVKYGFYSEDSGDPAKPDYVSAAETLGIADRYGEVWIFHVLTGPQNASAVWAAQRVLDTHVVVVANGFVIREMDLDDSERFMASGNVLSFAEEMGWWNRSKASSTSLLHMLHQRQIPCARSDVTRLLRDYFQGTPYDLSKGLAAGPFGNPMRWGGDEKGVVGGWERPISMYRTVFSFVLQARAHLPDAIGGVAWYGQSSPHASVYVPFSCAQQEVPAAYVLGKESEFTHGSAWWAFAFVNNWSMLRFDAIGRDIRARMAELQKACFMERKSMERHVTHTKSLTTSDVRAYLQEQSNRLASRVIDEWWAFAWKLVGKYADGYITTGEAPNEMEMPGYPEWWLRLSEFSKWPGGTLVPPHIPKLEKQLELFESRQNVSANLGVQASGCDGSVSSSSSISIAQLGFGAVVGAVMGASATWFAAQRQQRSRYQSIP
ncbi:Winged helix-turn-helix DNA-binding domain [Phytophthora cactorum]|nr:Winged helix-turn-helix DNA-binding domain [Phytophthora cactorum]